MTVRTPDRRPNVVLFDVMETLLDLSALHRRFTDLGRPEHEMELFFARTLRNGMAHTLAGEAPPFAELAAEELIVTSGLDEAGVAHVLAGFAELPAQPDAAPALRLLREAGIPAYAFTHGGPDLTEKSLRGNGLLADLQGVMSSQAIASFKPPRRVYDWACEQVGSAPERTALVAVHSWDTHGALRAGLLSGLATRFEGRLPRTVDRPHVVAETLDQVVAQLLAFD